MWRVLCVVFLLTPALAGDSGNSECSFAPVDRNFNFAQRDATILEHETLNVTVTRAQAEAPCEQTVKVLPLPYDGHKASASPGADFGSNPVHVTFKVGQKTAWAEIPIVDDAIVDGDEDGRDERFTLELDHVFPDSLGNSREMEIRILDNDGSFAFTRSSWRANDTATEQVIQVEHRDENVTSENVTVRYEQAGPNATASGAIVLTFLPDDRTKNVTIPFTPEHDPLIQLFLESPTGRTFLASPAQASIRLPSPEGPDHDAFVSFQEHLFRTAEIDGGVVITVDRTGNLSSTVSVDYEATAGTADADDFDPISGTLTFRPQETRKTFVVGIKQDNLREDAETVWLRIHNATNAGFGPISSATLLILGDEPVDESTPWPLLAPLLLVALAAYRKR